MRLLAVACVLIAACGGTADLNSEPSGTPAVTPKAEEPPSHVGQMTMDLYQSGSRIKPRIYQTEDGATIPTLGYRDTKLNMDCTPVKAADNVMRCLPNQAAAIGFYADAACAHRLAFTIGRCGTPIYASEVVSKPDVCELAVSIVYAVGAEYTGDVYYESSMMCAPVGAPVPAHVFYLLGAEVPPDTFAKFTEKVLD
jgi:hypothetical protein